MAARKHRNFDLYLEDNDMSSPETDDPDIGDLTLEPSHHSTPRTPPRAQSRLHPVDHKPPRPTSHRESHHDPTREHWRSHMRGPPSVATVESLSTIPAADGNVQEVYQELEEINQKLKREFRVLHERDLVLKQKDKSLHDLQMSLSTAIENETKRRLAAREQELHNEYRKLDDALKEKTRENKRLKENFDALKNANDILRRELDTLTHSHEKLEKQYSSMQARFINLQRKKDYEDKKVTECDMLPSDLANKVKYGIITSREQKTTATKKPVKNPGTVGEVMSSLLDWVADSQLRQSVVDQPTRLPKAETSREILEDRCFKMLPHMVDLIREQACLLSRVALPALQFIYWALVHLEASQSQHQRSSLSSTLRRLGEDLYRGRQSGVVRSGDCEDIQVAPPGECGEKQRDKDGLFFRSSHLHTRFLSSLIILKSLTQVDYLAQVYEVLRADLKTDSGKEYFLYYQATPIMLHHLKPTNKALINNALDIYLQMSMDSIHLRNFLDSCSNETWFHSVSLLWRMPGIEPKQLEKLSILLQKLSKIRTNKRYFEVYGLTTSCQDLQRTATGQSPFLALNLKSIVFNLTNSKTQSKSVS